MTGHHSGYLWGASVTGAFWWAVDAWVKFGPGWEVVPPILFALVSAWNAISDYRIVRDQARRRHKRRRPQTRTTRRPKA